MDPFIGTYGLFLTSYLWIPDPFIINGKLDELAVIGTSLSFIMNSELDRSFKILISKYPRNKFGTEKVSRFGL